MPAMEPLAPIIDQIREIARDEIPSPRAMKIALWDDGDYDIHVYHSRGSDERIQVLYDNESGAVLWQHIKLDPDWEIPDHEEIPDGEERIVVPEYEFKETRQLSVIDPPEE